MQGNLPLTSLVALAERPSQSSGSEADWQILGGAGKAPQSPLTSAFHQHPSGKVTKRGQEPLCSLELNFQPRLYKEPLQRTKSVQPTWRAYVAEVGDTNALASWGYSCSFPIKNYPIPQRLGESCPPPNLQPCEVLSWLPGSRRVLMPSLAPLPDTSTPCSEGRLPKGNS